MLPDQHAAHATTDVSSIAELMIRSGSTPSTSAGILFRLSQNASNPKALPPASSQPFDETNPYCKLPRSPQGRQGRPVAGKDLFAAAQDGADIEERAVGVEHECLDHHRLHHGCEAGWPMTASRNLFANSSAARSSAASCSKALTPTEATVASGPKTILMPLNEQSSP